MSSGKNNDKSATGHRKNIVPGIFVALVLATGGGGVGLMASTAFVTPSFAQTGTTTTTNGDTTSVALAGQVSSVQMGTGGDEGWEQSGFWVLRTQFQNNTTPESADDIEWSQFVARFDMFRPDGSELHSHTVYNFELASYQIEEVEESTLRSFTGNATVTMPDQVIEQVSTIIQIEDDSAVQILLGGDVEDHFGAQPLNGTLSDVSRDRLGELTGEQVGNGTDNGNGAPTNGNGTGTTNGNATDTTLRLTTEMQEYQTGEIVMFTAENLSNDTLTFSNAALGIEITNTDTNQTYSIIAAQVLTTILGGESAQVEWDQEGGDAEPGNYTAAVATVEGTPPSASAETSFTIVDSGQGQEPEQEEEEEEEEQPQQ